ncbi:GNAT family N-acetyltransferase [Streptomyces sp. NPDC002467]|uniref:GNAT family N-acetyltransferase n=1 Tax=Streptomyces sp. NPDC002467 TaxID=3364647 RepID=UPI0036C4CC32
MRGGAHRANMAPFGASGRAIRSERRPVMAQAVAAPREVHVLLADGATVSVRPVRADDLAEVAAFYDGISPENLRLRFFTANRHSAEQSAKRVCRPESPGRRALLAEAGGEAVGLVEYERLPGTDHADLALAVADRRHHRGVGTVLLEHAVSLAGSDGIAAFVADALSENRDALHVFADLGLSVSRRFDGPEVHCLGRFRGKLAGVLVHPMARRGVELFAGVVQDQVFGPLVMFGLGGTATELLADHAARLAPLTDQDVHDLLGAPRSAPLLFGHRGSEPVDEEALGQLLARLSRLAGDLPQLAEADLNPVIARPDGLDIVDVRMRLAPARPYDPYLRRLR